AANTLNHKMMTIAAHDLGVPLDDLVWNEGTVSGKKNPDQKLTWNDIVLIAHRHYYRMPEDMEPGLTTQHVMQVPNGGKLPTDDDRIQMYPCFSFEFHVVLMSIDPDIGKPEFRRYVIGHDCGTVINPKIVHGMTMGGIAHGIGAALLEEFAYDDQGQLLTQSFMDYLLPSAHEVPKIETVHQVTPSPLTVFGQKGSGESGYLGAPAAISSAINDALRPLGIKMNSLPLKITKLGDAIAAARAKEAKQ
ncbi:MAG: xanthine dehydrogenase family protein molybdopterin-binding subunit, partial [Xanthobacteraceae bacterium]